MVYAAQNVIEALGTAYLVPVARPGILISSLTDYRYGTCDCCGSELYRVAPNGAVDLFERGLDGNDLWYPMITLTRDDVMIMSNERQVAFHSALTHR